MTSGAMFEKLGRIGGTRTLGTIGVWSALVLGSSAGFASPDPCLLTVTEARSLGGTDTVQAGGSATQCSYMAADASLRLSISVYQADAAESQETLTRLADRERFTERKSGRARTWVSSDKVEGWVLSGEVLASVSAPGELNGKRRRKLELTVFQISEKLR